MTDIGYKEILTRISSVAVADIPKDLNIDELRAWLVGYSQAIDTVKKVIEELKEGRE